MTVRWPLTPRRRFALQCLTFALVIVSQIMGLLAQRPVQFFWLRIALIVASVACAVWATVMYLRLARRLR